MRVGRGVRAVHGLPGPQQPHQAAALFAGAYTHCPAAVVVHVVINRLPHGGGQFASGGAGEEAVQGVLICIDG